jgi:ethanolamine utilization microcompartment shell protein EutS
MLQCAGALCTANITIASLLAKDNEGFLVLLSLENNEALGLVLIKDERQGQTESAGSLRKASMLPCDMLQCAGAHCTANITIASLLAKVNESFLVLLSLENNEALGLMLIKDERQGQTASAGSLREASMLPCDMLQCAGALCTAKITIASLLAKDNESIFRCLLSLEKGEALGLPLIKGERQGQTDSAVSLREASTLSRDMHQCAGALCTAKITIASLLAKDNESCIGASCH